jgi:cysteine synthase A
MTESVLAAIGNTPLVPLQRVTPANGPRVLVKLEWRNPTGSMKDRMALGLISKWEADGRIKPGDTIVEYTGGSTETSLAFVCRAKGLRMHAVSSRAFSQEKLDHMAALGAQLTLVPYDGRGMRREMFLDMIAAAKALASERTRIGSIKSKIQKRYRATTHQVKRFGGKPTAGSTRLCDLSEPGRRCAASRRF